MDCPRCQIELTNDRCPRCGFEVKAPGRTPRQERNSTPRAPQEALRFSVSTSSPPEGPSDSTSDWRAELKRKLEQHQGRKQATSAKNRGREPDRQASRQPTLKGSSSVTRAVKGKPESMPKVSNERETRDSRQGDLERKSFHDETDETGLRSPRKIVTFRKQESRPSSGALAEKPLIRSPIRSRRKRVSSTPVGQGSFKLEELELPDSVHPPFEPPRSEPEAFELSTEVLLSRLLAVVIDFMLALLAGFLFSFAASRLLQLVFLSPALLQLAVGCALIFFFFNSVFFLLIAGQTPGMMWTDLELLGEGKEPLSFKAVLARALLFWPVVASVVGLLSAFLDPQRRCWHDTLSGTRVVPRQPDSKH